MAFRVAAGREGLGGVEEGEGDGADSGVWDDLPKIRFQKFMAMAGYSSAARIMISGMGWF